MEIKCKGQLIDLSTPKVMGVMNVTPDSFLMAEDIKRNMKSSPELMKC